MLRRPRGLFQLDDVALAEVGQRFGIGADGQHERHIMYTFPVHVVYGIAATSTYTDTLMIFGESVGKSNCTISSIIT